MNVMNEEASNAVMLTARCRKDKSLEMPHFHFMTIALQSFWSLEVMRNVGSYGPHVWKWHNGSQRSHPLTLQFLQWFLRRRQRKERKRRGSCVVAHRIHIFMKEEEGRKKVSRFTVWDKSFRLFAQNPNLTPSAGSKSASRCSNIPKLRKLG